MNKKSLIFIFIIIVLLVIFLCVFDFDKDSTTSKKKNENLNLLTGKYYVEMNIEKYGIINLELDADAAPITVTNFINLVNDKFYDGLTFHRIIDGFMIQGGGYEQTGERKNTKSIKGEFNSNGVVNTISHKRGVISMARTSVDKNSASSEFFIVQEDSTFLDGDYAAFGYVIDGLDVVDKIAKKAKPTDDNGSIDIKDRPVIKYVKVIDNK